MKARIVDESALRAISPQALHAYARGEGWSAVERYGEHSQVYANAATGDEIVIPGTSQLGDYEAVVVDLITHFANAESRGELQVYRDLVSADCDVVRVRLPDAEDDGSVAIDAGVDLFSNSRQLIMSAACAAWAPKRSYRAGKVKQADDYMQRVRLGQTEQGSFVVTLLAPVPPVIEENQTSLFWPEVASEPYERKVTRRLATGLDAAADAVEKFNLGSGAGVFDAAIPFGLSANLCDAAAALSDRGEGFEVSVTWARTRPAPVRRWSRTFTRAEGLAFREVSRLFREKDPRPDENIQGFVVKLARHGAADDDGDVIIRAYVDDALVSIRSRLEPQDYHVAIEAHDLHHMIEMTGTLERVKQRWRLSNPTDVRRVAEEEDGSSSLF
jgi:hypothetical protein